MNGNETNKRGDGGVQIKRGSGWSSAAWRHEGFYLNHSELISRAMIAESFNAILVAFDEQIGEIELREYMNFKIISIE